MLMQNINVIPVHAGRGRPTKTAQAKRAYYQLSAIFSTPLKNSKNALEQVGLLIITSSAILPHPCSFDKLFPSKP